MRVVVAPDKFKGTLSARAAAGAIERGILDVHPNAHVTCVPLADGGEGTVDALSTTEGATRVVVGVDSPEGAFECPAARLLDGSVCIEVASTSGLVAQSDALHASSARTGYALAALLEEDPTSVLVAVGGSSSTDGGAGIATALGWRLLDGSGADLDPGGGPLAALARLERAAEPPVCPVVGLCDVANPLLGPLGSAQAFGPQKGASQPEVEALEVGLARLAATVRSSLGVEIATGPFTGAGGGIGAGLVAFLEAELRSGFGFVAEALSLRETIAGADLVITGEGRLDEGSLGGKVSAGVARIARLENLPVVAVCGEVTLSDDLLDAFGFVAATDAVSIVGRERALSSPEEAVALATKDALRSME